MKILNDTRRSKLADYALNISVASLVVAAFEGNILGIFPCFAGLAMFFLLTKED